MTKRWSVEHAALRAKQALRVDLGRANDRAALLEARIKDLEAENRRQAAELDQLKTLMSRAAW